MGLVSAGCSQAGWLLEDDEGESSGPACVGVCLEVHALDLPEGLEVLLDVGVLGFLRQTSNEKLALVLGGQLYLCLSHGESKLKEKLCYNLFISLTMMLSQAQSKSCSKS